MFEQSMNTVKSQIKFLLSSTDVDTIAERFTELRNLTNELYISSICEVSPKTGDIVRFLWESMNSGEIDPEDLEEYSEQLESEEIEFRSKLDSTETHYHDKLSMLAQRLNYCYPMFSDLIQLSPVEMTISNFSDILSEYLD